MGARRLESGLLVAVLLAFLITPAHAQLTLTYPVEPNGGNQGPRADHQLIPFRFQVDTAGTDTSADVLFRHQGGGALLPDSLGVTLNVSIATPQVGGLFEGVTQIIARAQSNQDPTNIDFGPATYVNNQPLFILVETGPPNNPFVNVAAPNGALQVFDPQNARVTFTTASTPPFTVTVTGNVTNIPPDPNNPNTPPSDEVGASVLATLVPFQFTGSVAPLPAFQGRNTSPITITFPSTIADPFPPPAQNPPGPGQFAFPTYNFTNVADGIYQLRFTAQDIAGNPSPVATASVVIVDIDRVLPVPGITFPAVPPLIVGGALPTVFDLRGRIADERLTPSTVGIAVLDTGLSTLFTTTAAGASGTGDFVSSLNFTPGGPIVPGGAGPQDIFRIDVTATDFVGNPSATTANTYILLDLQAPQQPVITSPLPGSGTSALSTRVQGTLSNILAGQETLEEHGQVFVRITATSQVDPTFSLTVVVQASPSTAEHDSELDNAAGFSIPPDVLGDIPDSFDFDAAINLAAFPRGGVTVTAVASDTGGNTSVASAPVTFQIGDNGPAAAIDFTQSGPDDNYQLYPLIANRFASDDNDVVNGVGGFFISLKSPERFDQGNPPAGTIPLPTFPPGGTDPGDVNTLLLSVSAQDVATPIISLTATGASIPATTFTPAPGLNVNGVLAIDITGLPEGIPELINVTATNQTGQTGTSTSVVVIRDVVAPAAPRITSPALQPFPTGGGILPSFFTGQGQVTLTGTAEPNSLVIIQIPTAIGSPVTPLPQTSNTAVPNPNSDLTPGNFPSSPVFRTRASSTGAWTLAGIPLNTLASSVTTPTPIILQAIDTFDNTDPVRSVTTFGIIRSTAVGDIVEVRLDPRGRNFQIFPAPATVPAIEQFFREETIEIRVRYSTVITEAPVMNITQFTALPRPATLVEPASSTAIATSTLTYRYTIRPGDGTADGSATVGLTGGRDIFGFVPNPSNFPDAFFVDTVAPVLAPGGFTSFFPVTGAAVNAITTISVSAQDDPADNGSQEASCISTAFTSVRLRGPIEGATVVEIPLTFVPPAPDSQNVSIPCGPFTFLLEPTVAVTQDGTYEILAEIGDNVGNRRAFSSAFELDTQPIPAPLVVCDPADRSAVTTLPLFTTTLNTTQAVFVTVLEQDIDPALSNVRLLDPAGQVRGQAQITTADRNTLVVEVVPPLPGSPLADGEYSIVADLFDRAGNPSLPVTCTFILDTVPPTITQAFPRNDGCIGPPLSEVQAQVQDPPAGNAFPPAPSGFSIERSDIALRLITPDRLNMGAPNSRVTSIKRLRTTTGPPDILQVQFANPDMSVRRLRDDGTEDGRYAMEVLAVDTAGNTATVRSFFDYDSQPPHVTLDNFPEGSFLADTLVIAAGEAFDLGPCGFTRGATVTEFTTDSVQVSIIDLDEQGRPIETIVAPFFDFQNSTVIAAKQDPNPVVLDHVLWAFAAAIPNAPGNARLRVRVRDRAGNFNIITRDITIKQGPLDPPELLTPPDGSQTTAKVVSFDWRSVIQAFTYDLELTRVTPTNLTTTTTFSGIQFPRHGFGPLDLTTFVAAVPGGSPITTASQFRWRVRSNDVSLNPGPFSTPFTFTVDPTAPALGPVIVNGATSPSTLDVIPGTNTVTLTFAEDAQMDPAAGINVFLRVRDGTIPLIPFTTITYSGNTWVGELRIPVPGITGDLSGPGEIIVRDARNLSGTPLPESRVPVFVDLGPFFGVRFFANPVIPEELQIVVKAFPDGGSTEPLELTTPPTVLAFQHGEAGPRLLTVRPIGTIVPFSAFRTFFRVDRRKIGFVDFTLTGTNVAGRTATRTVSTAVAPALALARARFFMKDGRTSLALDGEPPEHPLTFLVTPDELVPPDLVAAATQAASQRGLIVQERLAWVQTLEAGETPSLSLETRRPASSPGAGWGLAIYDPADGSLEWVGSAREESLQGVTRRLGLLVVARDGRGPEVTFEDPGLTRTEARPRLTASFADAGSGVDPSSVRGRVGEIALEVRSPETGSVELVPAGDLGSGEHEVVIEVSDRAGNVTTTRHALHVDVALTLGEAIIVPNPVRSDFPARLRYRLSRPAEVSVRFFDVAGRTVLRRTEAGMAGPNDLFFDAVNERGDPLGNGVYFFKIRVAGEHGEKIESRGKFAVMR